MKKLTQYLILRKEGGWLTLLEKYNQEYAKEMEEVADWWEKVESDAVKNRNAEIFKVRQEISQYIKKYPEFCRKKRMEYLESLKKEEEENYIKGDDSAVDRIYKIEQEKDGRGITDEMIENAKNFPIEQIIEVNQQGFALCPFHSDNNPSAYTRNNYLYCFACSEQADTIKLYMHLNNCSFPEAVKRLQS